VWSRGRAELQLYSAMTTALEGGEWLAARPGRNLPPGKNRYPFYRRLGGPQGRSGQVWKISAPPVFVPRTLQSVAQPLYRLSYPARNRQDMIVKNKRERTCILIDGGDEWQETVSRKELKHKSLCKGIILRWILKCMTVPVRTGATGVLTKGSDGFGGLVFRMLASGSRVRGFKPGRSLWIFLYI
jgi:hypothetical protein